MDSRPCVNELLIFQTFPMRFAYLFHQRLMPSSNQIPCMDRRRLLGATLSMTGAICVSGCLENVGLFLRDIDSVDAVIIGYDPEVSPITDSEDLPLDDVPELRALLDGATDPASEMSSISFRSHDCEEEYDTYPFDGSDREFHVLANEIDELPEYTPTSSCFPPGRLVRHEEGSARTLVLGT